jgi:hypothetical protein
MPVLCLDKEARQSTTRCSVPTQKKLTSLQKFAKPRFFERGTVQAQQVALNFEPSKDSTNSFACWIGEPLHPAFLFF